jgi:hypothetical protein
VTNSNCEWLRDKDGDLILLQKAVRQERRFVSG